MPAPSAMTKPSRPRSKGRLAVAGSSLRRDRLRITAKPATAMGSMQASDPPAMITSAPSSRMQRQASPMLWLPAAQAVLTQRLGPSQPWRSAMLPAAMLVRMRGRKKGERPL
jgi:hypothetical protein